ncbi:AMP-binding protein [Actinoplanes sp. CA-030573]|uniref:AMP-dependent synthetase/ligase n=1 Tax=Actinoplanes sp. CA-030573 TaxID=3239898 RepID=UPI003D8CAEAA
MSHPRYTVLESITFDEDAPPTMVAAFRRTVAARGDEVALRTAGGGPSYTWSEYAARVAEIAGGLAAHGVKRGDTVALLLTNRPEFHFADTAVQHLGAVPFSCYNTSSPEQLGYLLRASGARVAITESALAPAMTGHLGDPSSPLDLLVLVDTDRQDRDGEDGGGSSAPPPDGDEVGTGEDGGGSSAPPADGEGTGDHPDGEDGGGSTAAPAGKVVALADIVAPGFDLEAAASAVTGDDLLTLVYTSGTTGRPKGVEITHAAMVAMVSATAPLVGVRPGDRLISFLPAAHIADRWASHYLHLWSGTEVTCLADHRQIAAALVEVRPTLFGGVPQVWLRLVAGIKRLPDPVMAGAVEQAVEIGRQYLRARAAGEVPADLEALHAAADVEVLAPLRAKLGLDQVRVAVTAAAPTPPEVIEFVNAAGVPLIEAWGMSELSGMATMVPLGEVRPGSIGLPVPGLEVRLLDDGELLVRGPMVMRGYRGQPEETAAAIDDDGWLHTGDVATRDADGYLRIVDRKKELLITQGGKNIAPAAVELALRSACPLLAQAVVIGDGRPHLTALLVLDPEAAAAFTGLVSDPVALVRHPGVQAAVAAGVSAANATLSRAEHVRAYELLPEVWAPGGDLVTPTMKVRRGAVLRRYAESVEALYGKATAG